MAERKIVSTEGYRGTRDFYPSDMRKLKYIFSTWRRVAERYGYSEYLSPLVENWDLYAAKNVSGEEIVNEQLYWFEDRGGRKIAIRPEMTPSVARMVAARSQELPKPIRWFSIANFMRYEKPQRGRVREFFQLNIDLFGDDSVQADAEIIETAAGIMREFGATAKMFRIYVNNRAWMDFWIENVLLFKGDSRVLRKIIDRMPKQAVEENTAQLEGIGASPQQIEQVLNLPKMTLADLGRYKDQSVGAASLVDLFSLLDKRGLGDFVQFNASIMRGLDYYTGNVFEQFDLSPDNNRSMFGGGRYDDLVDMFGGDNMTAVGYAPGDVTTLNFLEAWNLLPDFGVAAEVLVTVFDETLADESWRIANQLRMAGINVELYLQASDKLSAQLNYANKIGVQKVVIIGDNERSKGVIVCKDMLSGEQRELTVDELIRELLSAR